VAAPAATEPVALALSPPWREREWTLLLRRLVRRRTALFGLVVIAVVALTAAFAPVVAPFDPLAQDIGQRLREPGWQDAQGRLHPLGTDHLGRDILARIIYGSPSSSGWRRWPSPGSSAWPSGSSPATSGDEWTIA
jgi:ABC-type dipeptide/oligopeptide/nickel transport system permease subunit